MVELGEAGGHLAAARSGGGDDHQGAGGLDIIVLTVALVADDEGHVAGIALDAVVAVHLDPHVLQLGLELVRAALAAVLGDHNAAHIEALVLEFLDQAEHVHVVGDSQVVAHFVLFNVRGVDGDDQLRLVGHLQQHPQLAVRGKAGEHSGGVEVVEELSAEFQVQFVAELADALFDVF